MRMHQDSSCSWSIWHCSSFVGALISIFWALAFFLSVGTPWRLSLGCFSGFTANFSANTSSAGRCIWLIFQGFLQITVWPLCWILTNLLRLCHLWILLWPFYNFMRFVTSDFGGFAKSLNVFWLNNTLSGEKLGFERNFLFFHCQFSTAVISMRFIHR